MMSKRELLAYTLERTGLGSLLSLTVGRWNGLLVFNYHRVGNAETSPFDRALFSATQDEFASQVRFLKQHADVIRVADLDSVTRRRGRAVMLTFDDGYRDNFELALPVLAQEQVSATFFITSGFLDRQILAWWDEIAWMVRNCEYESLPVMLTETQHLPLGDLAQQEAAIKRLLRYYKGLPAGETAPFLDHLAEATGSGRCPAALARQLWMTWEMVRGLDRQGMDIGGHTVNHPVLANSPLGEQRQEIIGSKQRIEQELGHPITAFSYPVGQPNSFSSATKELLHQAGYRWAFSFSGGFSATDHADHFDLPRVAVSSHLSRELFCSTARLPWLFA